MLRSQVRQGNRTTAQGGGASRRHKFRDFDLEHFWAWDDISSYIEFLVRKWASLLRYMLLRHCVVLNDCVWVVVYC